MGTGVTKKSDPSIFKLPTDALAQAKLAQPSLQMSPLMSLKVKPPPINLLRKWWNILDYPRDTALVRKRLTPKRTGRRKPFTDWLTIKQNGDLNPSAQSRPAIKYSGNFVSYNTYPNPYFWALNLPVVKQTHQAIRTPMNPGDFKAESAVSHGSTNVHCSPWIVSRNKTQNSRALADLQYNIQSSNDTR